MRFDALLTQGTVKGLRLFFKCAEGKLIPVSMNARVMRGDDGVVRGVVVTIRDLRDEEARVAEQRRVDARLRQAERLAALGTLVAGVAHEVNNPLSAVLGNTEFVLENLEDRAVNDRSVRVLAEALAESKGATKRIRDIVRSLRIFLRGETMVKRAVDVNQAIQDAIRLVAENTRDRARVVMELDEVPPILADETKLGQVVANLVVNAAQAMPLGDTDNNSIRVATRREGADHVVITIADTGPGLPEVVKGQLFTPFTTTKDIGQGMGLGLSIVHGLVTAMDGEISVESEEGRGTVFEIRLPIGVAPPVQKPAHSRPAQEAVKRGARILLIDDDSDLGNLVRRTWSPPHDLTVETRAADALGRLKAGNRFDAIFCDILMPGMSGIEFYDALVAVAADERRKVAFMTGSTCSAEVDFFLARAGRPHLTKPFTRSELDAVLAAIVGA